MTSREELEAAILAQPDEAEGYLVLADWLQSQGDPQGELIILQHRAALSPSTELTERISAWHEQHGQAILGKDDGRPEGPRMEWMRGFVDRIVLIDDALGEELSFLARNWHRPVYRMLRTLEVEQNAHLKVDNEWGSLFSHTVAFLKKHRPPLLETLLFGQENPPGESYGAGPVSDLCPDLPRLKRLEVCVTGSLELKPMHWPELRTFAARTDALNPDDLEAILTSQWPQLESLEIWGGAEYCGADVGVENFEPLFDAQGWSKLKTLRLRHCEFADQLIPALASSRLLPQLEVLDLSSGVMSTKGAEALQQQAKAFARLRVLNIDDNAVPVHEILRLKRVLPNLKEGTQHDYRESNRDRYVSGWE